MTRSHYSLNRLVGRRAHPAGLPEHEAAAHEVSEPPAAATAEPSVEPRSPAHRARFDSPLDMFGPITRMAGRSQLHHLLPSLFLVAAAAFTFQQTLFFGYRLIGNSDRLNHYLSFILYHTHYLERGQFAAWSDFVYGGFDTLSLPMSFITPLYALPALLHTDDVVAVFGVIAPALLAATLVETYAVAYLLTHDRLASVASACTYGCATYGLLKLVQSDQTYLSVLTAPIFFYLIHTTTGRNWLRRFIALTLFVAIEFYFAFLQEFSYNVIFLLIYTAYLAVRRNWYPLATFSAALISGAALSLPRLLVQYATVTVSGRDRSAPVVQDLVDRRSLLRFFSRDIFGHSWRDQLQLPVQINLHEGDLLHSSVFGALLLVLIILSFRWIVQVRSDNLSRSLRIYGIVMVPYVLFIFAVMHSSRVYLLFARLYQNVSFQHSRLCVSAMFPVALVSALYLAQGRRKLGRRDALVAAVASLVVIAASAFDFSSIPDYLRTHTSVSLPAYVSCDRCLPGISSGPLLTWDLLRLATLATLFIVLVIGGALFGDRGWSVAKTVLAGAIVFQAIWGAADYVGGPQTREYIVPYEYNDFVTARSDQFLPPTPTQLEQMQRLLDNDNYRSVTVCPGDGVLMHPDCNTALGMTWRIRLLDGYSSGVPQRLAALPQLPVRLHDIRFGAETDLHWKTLSFLNVRQAIVITGELFMNAGLRAPEGVQLIANPSPYVYPRAYFASTTRGVDASGAAQAVKEELTSCRPTCDDVLRERFPIDFVEGGVTGEFDASGTPTWTGDGDRLTFDFPASSQSRFLIVNEMWDPGWTAYVNGQETAVKPTNMAMRGVLAPPGATQVVLVYHSLLWWAWWYALAVALALSLVLFVVWKRTQSMSRS